jgi:hypothetical protein
MDRHPKFCKILDVLMVQFANDVFIFVFLTVTFLNIFSEINMKKNYRFNPNFRYLFVLLLLVCSCGKDNNTTQPVDELTTKITAQISGSVIMDYRNTDDNTSKSDLSTYLFLEFSKINQSSKTVYDLWIHLEKFSKNKTTYYLSSYGDSYAEFGVFPLDDLTYKTIYYYNQSGTLKITSIKDNTIQGTFSFDASTKDGTKTISVKNGTFVFVKGK